jgi:hypothetical protein
MSMRKNFLSPDFELFSLRERLFKTTQHGTLHDYIAAFQNVLIQCQSTITELEKRFYFEHGLALTTRDKIHEHSPATLDECIELALRYDQSSETTKSADWMKSATCHRCHKMGHIAPNCPEKGP